MNYTPGLWSFDEQSGCVVMPKTQSASPCVICRVFVQAYAHAEGPANGRLIAAAPELYEVLKALSDSLPSDEYLRSEGSKPDPRLQRMRNALAKAEGSFAS